MDKKSVQGRNKCAYTGCKNTQVTRNLHFHKFPKDEKRSRLWVAACGRRDLKNRSIDILSTSYKICSDHFDDDMFGNAMEKRKLLHFAIPRDYNEKNSWQIKRKVWLKESQTENIKHDTDVLTGTTPMDLGNISNIFDEYYRPIKLEQEVLVKCPDNLNTDPDPLSILQPTYLSLETFDSTSSTVHELNKKVKSLEEEIEVIKKELKDLKSFRLVTKDDFKLLCDQFLDENLSSLIKSNLD